MSDGWSSLTGCLGASSLAERAGERVAQAAVLLSEDVQFCLEGGAELAERLW
jgi:hypothetical protein